MNADNDNELFESIKQGDSVAITELYNRYWRAARAAAYGVTAEINLAEDAASEAFYSALKNLSDLEDTNRFGPWLHKIVVRKAKHILKNRSKENNIDPQILSKTCSQTPDSSFEQKELANLIREAVGILSESHREAISLFCFEGYSLKEASGFLGIPLGTLKRRLHEGRQQLKDKVEKILDGRKTMTSRREKIIKKVEDVLKEGIDSEAFFQAVRDAHRLRPVPNELFQKLGREIFAQKQKKYEKISPEKQKKWREMMNRIYSHSDRAQNPNHPVGIVSNAIRAELSEFKSWQADFSKVDMLQMLKNMYEGNRDGFSVRLPPAFFKDTQGAYIFPITTFLILDEDGSYCTCYELGQKMDSWDSFKKQSKRNRFLSDTLNLLWKEQETIELKMVENLLRRLYKAIIPAAEIHFVSYEEPCYRAALRMQIEDNPVPAAIAGVLNPRPEIYGEGSIASATIYLEPWAYAQSGQTINLSDISPLIDLLQKKT